jgi:carboxyl-terminal processing protease
MTNSKTLLPLLLMLFLAGGILIGRKLNRSTPTEKNSVSSSKIQDIISKIDQEYVDPIEKEKLMEETIDDMLHKLDPHSNYIPAKDLKAMNEQMSGKFGGVGIRFAIIRDTLCVTNVIANSPAFRSGLKSGDRIIAINGKAIAGNKVKTEEIMGKLKGDPGTPVKVTLYSLSKKKRTVSIVRDFIPLYSIVCAQMIDKNTGYIRLESFSETSEAEFKAAAKKLLGQGMKKLIFDLRDNPGGLLSAAIAISDEFLPGGCKIVSVKGKNPAQNQMARSSSGGLLESVKTVVLLNENSASASEIVAGALQDNDCASIVGRRSFGKGLVQRDFQLKDQSNLRLTIARYYTPSGRCIQRPFDDNFEDYIHDEIDREKSGEYFHPDSSILKKAKKFYTRKGKIVYDGGGIMPDYFVPLDTSNSTTYYIALRYSSAFQHIAFDFANVKRGKWNSIQQYNSNFNPDAALIDKLVLYAEKNFDIKRRPADLKRSYALIQRALKAEIARQLFIEEGYFFVITSSDKEFQKAKNLLN